MAKRVLVAANGKHEDVRDVLSPLSVKISCESKEEEIERICRHSNVSLVVLDDAMYDAEDKKVRSKTIKIIQKSTKKFIIVSNNASIPAILEARDYGASDCILRPYNSREFITRCNAVMQGKTRIACVGGGTGLFHVLLGLKTLQGVSLRSIVSMSDEGGSSGRLKVSFGILPPGDIRKSLVALSNAPETMNQIMQHRFDKGEGLSGHSFGNLLLTVLSEIKGSFSEGVRALGDMLYIDGIVLPVTSGHARLCARFEDDTVVKGESKIDLAEGRHPDLPIKEVWHEPEVECNIDAFSAIINSEIVIIGPGDLYTSVTTNLLIKNIREAISQTRAKKVYICNLMTKPGETSGFSALDHVREIVKYLGGDYLDYIIISGTKLSKDAIAEYSKKQQTPVSAAAAAVKGIGKITKAKIIVADVSHETELVRHDSEKLKSEVYNILQEEKLK